MKKIRIFILLSLGCYLAGCSISKNNKVEILPPGMHHLAVLPMANETTNLDGPKYLRKALYKKLKHPRGFSIVPMDTTDSILNEIGITDGGQLGIISVKELGEKIPAKRLLYTNLLTFKPLRAITFEVIRVDLKMYDSGTGRLIFEDTFSVTSQKEEFKQSSVKDYFYYLFGMAFLEKLFRCPLHEEIELITSRISKSIHRRW